MSYELMVDGESLGMCGSNRGYSRVADFCMDKGKACKQLFFHGRCANPQQLREELIAIAKQEDVPADIASTIKAMIVMLTDVEDGSVTASSG